MKTDDDIHTIVQTSRTIYTPMYKLHLHKDQLSLVYTWIFKKNLRRTIWFINLWCCQYRVSSSPFNLASSLLVICCSCCEIPTFMHTSTHYLALFLPFILCVLMLITGKYCSYLWSNIDKTTNWIREYRVRELDGEHHIRGIYAWKPILHYHSCSLNGIYDNLHCLYCSLHWMHEIVHGMAC